MFNIARIRELLRLTRGAARSLYWKAWYVLFSNETILVLGDSHASVFGYWRFRYYFWRKKIILRNVQGATASGLQNPSSKTQAAAIFREALEKETYDRVFLQLGEVDTGFVIWYRAGKYNTSVEGMFHQAVSEYKKLIASAGLRAPVVVFSTPLPTISDDNDWGSVANLRKAVTASQVDRTLLTLKFNKKIATFCHTEGVEYISLDDASLGENGVVKARLTNRDPHNHHYSDRAYALLLRPLLKQYFQTVARKKARKVTEPGCH